MNGKILSIFCSIVAIPSLIYYTSKYYVIGSITFDERNLMAWSIVVGFTLLGLIFGIINSFKIDKLTKLLEEIQETQILNHHEEVKLHKNSRIFLKEVIKGDKG